MPDEDMPSLLEKLDTKGDGMIAFNKLHQWFNEQNENADDLPAERAKSPKSRKEKKKVK